MTILDLAVYLRIPVLNLATAIALADALIKAAPPKLEALALRAKQRLGQDAQAARDALVARQRLLTTLPERDTRALDLRADRLWSALRDRLVGFAVLESEGVPGAKRAGELAVSLFEPEGLTFLQQAYAVQLTIMETILQRVDEDGLAAEIDRYAGSEFLAALRPVVAEYGRMVSEQLRRTEAKAEDFSAHLATLRSDISDYAARVYATIDPEAPATMQRALAALVPIATLRARATSGSSSSTTESSPSTTEPDPNAPSKNA